MSVKSDATTAMRSLNTPRGVAAFPNGVAKQLIAHIAASDSVSERSVGADSILVHVVCKQNNDCFENYLTHKDWEHVAKFADGRLHSRPLMIVFARRAAAIRLYNPIPSVCSKAAAIAAASRPSMASCKELYDWARMFKDALLEFRTKKNRPTAGPTHYPPNAEDFLAQFPECYNANDPPIKSTIDDTELELAMSLTSCRNTNKKLKRDTISTVGDRSGSALVGHTAPLDAGVVAIQVLLNQLAQRQSTVDNPDIAIETLPRRRVPTDMLALQNGTLAGDVIAPACKNNGLAPNADVDDDDVEEDEDDIEGLIGRTSGAIAKSKAMMKKPSASMKRPAGIGSAKYTYTQCTTRPSMPDVTKSMNPMIYKGCKIMASQNKKAWRVFPNPGQSPYDKKFSWDPDPRSSWNRLIAFCDKPFVPTTKKQ